MITLRLFKTADPFQEIESRTLARGSLVLGRDAAADWQLQDTRGDISRRHCTIRFDRERVYVRDHSTNGVYVGADKRRAARDLELEVRAGETLSFGEYLLLIDQDPADALQAAPEALDSALPQAGSVSGAEYAHPATDAGMLEAFCRGAGVDPSSFVGEEPAAVMMRLGGVYRQVVEDLCLLLNDRAALKDTLKLDRTTISARDNNPLKWAAPQRVAVDLLREGDAGFLKGADAFKASFEDLRRHNASVMASSAAAVAFVLDDLSPEALEASLQRPQGLSFLSRTDALWKTYQARHASLAGDNAGAVNGRIAEATRDAYLVAMGPAGSGEAA